MSAFVDTSVLIRYLTGDPPEMLDAARRIVDETERLMLTDVVLPETAFVLLSFYAVPREAIVDSLVDLLCKNNIAMHGLDKDVVIQALLLCRPSGRVSFADAMLWAVARSAAGSEPATIFSFDQRFPSRGVDVRAG
ncbi:MAG: PIN domain-containing protein [Gemmatimonadota bacterium]|nr:PIN domain-containing protein [Gemmatimonadota bacterium]MDQ3525071.1 PIN domain-containing protein [Chloroflexota bacterium]